MAHTMDLGVAEAYRHEATVECEVRQEVHEECVTPEEWEHITVHCECGETFESTAPIGTYDAYELDDARDDEAAYLKAWIAHVYKVCYPAVVERAETGSQIRPAVPAGPEREAAARSAAWMYLENIERRVTDARNALNTPAGDFAEGSRIANLRTWAQQIAEQARWLQEDLNRIEKGE